MSKINIKDIVINTHNNIKCLLCQSIEDICHTIKDKQHNLYSVCNCCVNNNIHNQCTYCMKCDTLFRIDFTRLKIDDIIVGGRYSFIYCIKCLCDKKNDCDIIFNFKPINYDLTRNGYWDGWDEVYEGDNISQNGEYVYQKEEFIFPDGEIEIYEYCHDYIHNVRILGEKYNDKYLIELENDKQKNLNIRKKIGNCKNSDKKKF